MSTHRHRLVLGLACVLSAWMGALLLAQSTQLASHAVLSFDNNGYINVTATGAGSGTTRATTWANSFVKFDSSGYLNINCQSGCASVGGSNTYVQFNDNGVLGGDAGLTYNKTTDILTVGAGYVAADGVGGANGYTFGSGCGVQHVGGWNAISFYCNRQLMAMADLADTNQATTLREWIGDGGSSSISSAGAIFKAATAGGGNSNRAGTNLWIGGGESTGNGAAGDIVIAPGTTGGSGTTERAIAETFRLTATAAKTAKPILCTDTAPTISGNGTLGTNSKGCRGFVVSTTTGAASITLTFPYTAPTGWVCTPTNLTTANLIRQSSYTTTTAVLTGTTVTSDNIAYNCGPF